jgi:hypothetical protein
MGLPARMGQHLAPGPGTVPVPGYEHEYRVVERWDAPLDPALMAAGDHGS